MYCLPKNDVLSSGVGFGALKTCRGYAASYLATCDVLSDGQESCPEPREGENYRGCEHSA